MIFTQSPSATTTTVTRKPCTLEGTGTHAGLPCALKETRVDAQVAGFIAEVRVEHVFENPHDVPLTALYTFPLPHDAAVVGFEFVVAGKAIKGACCEKDEARQKFQNAAAAGQHAGLVEQERPNVFELELANIPARGHVKSTVTYLEALPYANGEFEFRFPTVVAPRYTPQGEVPLKGAGQPPVARAPHTVALALAVDAGMPIEDFRCDTHAISVARESGSRLRATLANPAELPDRDLIVRYKVGGEGIRLGLLAHRPDPAQDGTFYMFAVPPADVATRDVRGKEVVLLVDRSGSMGGEKMEKARESVSAFLHALNPADTFSIVLFDDTLVAFEQAPVAVSDANLQRAEKWLDRYDASGGTEVLPAIVAALEPPADRERQRIVVLITDGQVSNESQVLAYVRQNLRSARLFTVGIDTAVNTYLLAKLARFGRGCAEFVLPTGDIEGVIARLANRIGSPLLTDPHADFGNVRVSDLTPHPLPDVMAGQVVVVAGKYRGQGTTDVVFAGQGPGRLLEHRVEVTFPRESTATPACESIWARLMIDRLEEDLADDPRSATLEQKIVALATKHGLLSSRTSFVAIDEREGDPGKAKRAITERIANQLPAGWREEGFVDRFMSAPASHAGPASRSRSKLSACGSVRACAAPPPRSAAPAPGGPAKGTFDMLADLACEAVDTLSGLFDRSPAERDPSSVTDRLRELAKRQSVNGSWSGSAVETALAIAAFVQHGHSDRAGDFTAQVRRAVEFLEATLTSGWTAVPGSLDALAVAYALALLARTTGSGAHRTLADRFAQVGAAWPGAAAVNLAVAVAEVRAEAQRAGVAADAVALL